jgi:exodeoxyribonuclease V gamma subunit
MYDEGRRAPLPLPVKTSFAWADAVHTHRDPERSAGYRWKTDRFPADDAEPAHVRTWGERARLSLLVKAGLGDYACRLWLPMLRAMDV